MALKLESLLKTQNVSACCSSNLWSWQAESPYRHLSVSSSDATSAPRGGVGVVVCMCVWGGDDQAAAYSFSAEDYWDLCMSPAYSDHIKATWHWVQLCSPFQRWQQGFWYFLQDSIRTVSFPSKNPHALPRWDWSFSHSDARAHFSQAHWYHWAASYFNRWLPFLTGRKLSCICSYFCTSENQDFSFYFPFPFVRSCSGLLTKSCCYEGTHCAVFKGGTST